MRTIRSVTNGNFSSYFKSFKTTLCKSQWRQIILLNFNIWFKFNIAEMLILPDCEQNALQSFTKLHSYHLVAAYANILSIITAQSL